MFLLCFGFIMGMYLVHWVGRIHRIASPFLLKTPLKKIEEEEEGGSKGRHYGSESKDRHSILHKLSQLFFLSFIFFNFS